MVPPIINLYHDNCMNGMKDKPDNYYIVTYHIENISDNRVKFTWTQEGFANEEGQQHSENGLFGVLEQIKKLVEG